jgi:regulatory protein SWI5
MLVSPTSSLQKRHRQHRRQNSIPVAVEAAKVPYLPAPAMQRHQLHGRGLSLDQRASRMQSGQSPLENEGSLLNNDGYRQQLNVLRETQQPLLRQNQAYLDQAQSQMSSNAEYQTFGPGGLNVFTNLPSNENFSTNACMGPEAFGTANANNTAVHLNQPHGHPQQQHFLRNAALTVPIGQLYDRAELNTYFLERSGFPQNHPDKNLVPDNFRRGSVQSHLSQSYRPSTPPRQMNSSK